jgi:hypothetical protein
VPVFCVRGFGDAALPGGALVAATVGDEKLWLAAFGGVVSGDPVGDVEIALGGRAGMPRGFGFGACVRVA